MNEAMDIMKKLDTSGPHGWGAFAVQIAETGRNMEKNASLLTHRMKMEIQTAILKYESLMFDQQSIVLAEIDILDENSLI